MSLERLKLSTREEWLLARTKQGIGGSEAAQVVGMSNWGNPIDLWELKTGRKAAKDISDNEFVRRGVLFEPIIRQIFITRHPEFNVSYHQFDILYQKENPFIFATLDGEFETEDKKKGILEIKTASMQGKKDWLEWQDKVPSHYYIQILHQLLATGYDYAVLTAALFSFNGDITIREYEFDRKYCENDLLWLLDEEKSFYKHIEDDTMPSVKLVL